MDFFRFTVFQLLQHGHIVIQLHAVMIKAIVKAVGVNADFLPDYGKFAQKGAVIIPGTVFHLQLLL